MALQNFPNLLGVPVVPGLFGFGAAGIVQVGSIADAVGESTAFIGAVYLSTGPGTSKTISTGKIYWVSGAVTSSNASTSVKIGIQDVDATTGLEDGTYDVSRTLTGSGIVTANAIQTATMNTGTKTIAHGDIVAVVIEMTARGGADSVTVNRLSSTTYFPYSTLDTGAGPVKSSAYPQILLEFDDGTIGHMGEATVAVLIDSLSYASNSTPDEYALVFSLPFPAKTNALLAWLGETDTTETGELILYSSPLGTPVAERTITIDPDITALATNVMGPTYFPLSSEFSFEANIDYAVAYRPTSTGARLLQRLTLPIANARKAYSAGTTMRQATRTDQTGAFGSEVTTILPVLGCMLHAFDDGAGAATLRGVGLTTFMNGGVAG